LFGVEETVDRRECEIGELQIVVLHMLADPRAQTAREAHRDTVLGAADRGEGDRDAGIEGLGELGEGPLIDAPHRAARGLAVQSFAGLDHLFVQALG
jgi:hypothetical protein